MINPTYLNNEQTLIRIEKDERNAVIIEPKSDPQLWSETVAGLYGPVAAYEPEEDDGPPQIEATCSRLQAKIALLQAGLLDQANALIATMDPVAQLAWAEAGTWKRSSPLLKALAQQLTWADGEPLTSSDLDELFATASNIEV